MIKVLGEALYMSRAAGVSFWETLEQPLFDVYALLPLAVKEFFTITKTKPCK